MKICYVWDADYPWDIRVEKFCRTLIDAGHEVHLLCRNKRRLPVYEMSDGIHIHRHPSVKNKKLNSLIGFPAFFSPLWLYLLFKLAVHYRFDLIIVRDLPMALAGIAIGRFKRIPVAIDMAEVYPLGLRSNWQYNRMKPWDILVRNPFFADIVERITIEFANHIFVVSSEAKNRFLERGVSSESITLIGNTPNLELFNANISERCEKKLPRGAFNIVFVGIFTGNRGLKLAVSAMREVVRTSNKIHLTLVGNGWMYEELEKMVKLLGLEENIHFTGWIDNQLIPSIMADVDVGLLPFLPCEHIHITLPNKLFDYMAMGVPVLAADTRSLKRVVNETGCGITFKAGSEKDLADKILLMHADSELRRKCSEKGKKFSLKKYNWEKDGKRLLDAISRVCSKPEENLATSN